MSQDSERLARAWDETAGGYEEYFVPRFAPWVDLAVGAVTGPLPDGPILVPCCGTLPELEPLSAQHPGREIAGIDLSAAMVARARERAAGHPEVRVEVGDAAALDPRWEGNCAAVVSVFGLQQIPGPEDAMRSWAGALAPGGTLSVVFWPGMVGERDPFELVRQIVTGAAERPDSAWEDRLPDVLADAGLEVVRDEFPEFSMSHQDATTLWTAMSHSGPLRATALARGEDFIAEKGAEFLRRAPSGPLTHSPRARWLLATRP